MAEPDGQIRKATADAFAQVWSLLAEYFEAVSVEVRDDPDQVRSYLSAPGSGIWIGFVEESPAGCILLRALPKLAAHAAEVKRLYVRPEFRGRGLARELLYALE